VTARRLTSADHAGVLALLADLHPHPPSAVPAAFDQLLAHPGTSVWGVADDTRLVATATLHLLPNLTYGGRCYGVIENVVTAHDARRQGHGRTVLGAVCDHAWANGAYKLMLLSGQARTALGFYESLGFSAQEKHGLILRAP